MSQRPSEDSDSTGQPEPEEDSSTERGFIELLNTDLKDLEIAASLRRLGNKRVLKWDIEKSMPAVHKFAHQEVDVIGWVKRVASYKVMEWDFRDALKLADDNMPLPEIAAKAPEKEPEPADIDALVTRLKGFIQYVSVNLIDDPERAHFQVHEISSGVIRFRLVVTKGDQKILVGQNGETATALRNMLKGTAAGEGVHVLLEIITHEEELAKSLKEAGGN
ncbi:hypothetical protein [Luteolibacter flavescens]|nr:hypothetical protein [Luteolibacter flavescens]